MVDALNNYINSTRLYFDNTLEDTEKQAIRENIDKIYNSQTLSPLENLEQFDKVASIDIEKVEYYGTSLILDSGVKLRHYIKIDDFEDVKDKLIIRVGEKTPLDYNSLSSTTINGEKLYYFETSELNPLDFRNNISITYDYGTTEVKVIDEYSVFTFIKLSLGNEATAATNLATVCQSLFCYYLEAAIAASGN